MGDLLSVRSISTVLIALLLAIPITFAFNLSGAVSRILLGAILVVLAYPISAQLQEWV